MKIFRIAGAVFFSIALTLGIARVARAQQPAEHDEQQAQDLKKAGDVANRHRAELMKIQHVTGVVAEVGDDNEAGLLVEIDDPENTDDVTRKLPSQMEGFPVQVDVAVGDDSNDNDTDSDDDDEDGKTKKPAHSLAGGFMNLRNASGSPTPTPTATATPRAPTH
jgi:hypothetical protein